jgi:hypothetical protein
MSVELEAAKYLKNFLRLREEQTSEEVSEVTDLAVVPVADFHIIESVILTRHAEPRFYGGTLGKGDRQRPVWVHNIKQARSVSADRVHLYEEKLGVELLPMWPYA